MGSVIFCLVVMGVMLVGMYISGGTSTSCKDHSQSRDCNTGDSGSN